MAGLSHNRIKLCSESVDLSGLLVVLLGQTLERGSVLGR